MSPTPCTLTLGLTPEIQNTTSILDQVDPHAFDSTRYANSLESHTKFKESIIKFNVSKERLDNYTTHLLSSKPTMSKETFYIFYNNWDYGAYNDSFKLVLNNLQSRLTNIENNFNLYYLQVEQIGGYCIGVINKIDQYFYIACSYVSNSVCELWVSLNIWTTLNTITFSFITFVNLPIFSISTYTGIQCDFTDKYYTLIEGIWAIQNYIHGPDIINNIGPLTEKRAFLDLFGKHVFFGMFYQTQSDYPMLIENHARFILWSDSITGFVCEWIWSWNDHINVNNFPPNPDNPMFNAMRPKLRYIIDFTSPLWQMFNRFIFKMGHNQLFISFPNQLEGIWTPLLLYQDLAGNWVSNLCSLPVWITNMFYYFG
jgi:hypothetical protein